MIVGKRIRSGDQFLGWSSVQLLSVPLTPPISLSLYISASSSINKLGSNPILSFLMISVEYTTCKQREILKPFCGHQMLEEIISLNL